ncbi:MAG TPA: hypothetical protein O0X58_03625, partial [Methanocorpusculum sp.]|nr:hypothetical protein [Methanocorpusculum sp.]
PFDVEDFSAVPGRGVTAVSSGVRYYAGNAEYMKESGVRSFPGCSGRQSCDFLCEGHNPSWNYYCI